MGTQKAIEQRIFNSNKEEFKAKDINQDEQAHFIILKLAFNGAKQMVLNP